MVAREDRRSAGPEDVEIENLMRRPQIGKRLKKKKGWKGISHVHFQCRKVHARLSTKFRVRENSEREREEMACVHCQMRGITNFDTRQVALPL